MEKKNIYSRSLEKESEEQFWHPDDGSPRITPSCLRFRKGWTLGLKKDRSLMTVTPYGFRKQLKSFTYVAQALEHLSSMHTPVIPDFQDFN